MSDSWSDSEPDDEEASPNVEVLFQQAFAEADPAPSLLKVVDEHPTYEDIEKKILLVPSPSPPQISHARYWPRNPRVAEPTEFSKNNKKLSNTTLPKQ